MKLHISAAIGGIMILVCGAFVYSLPDMIANDKYLAILDHEFSSLTHPASTRHMRSEKRFGLLDGNGNHCDYFVGELRTYHDSKHNICQFYHDVTLSKSRRDEFTPRVMIEFFTVSNDIPDSVFDAWTEIVRNTPEHEVFEWCSHDKIEQGTYLVCVFFQDQANRDWRCH